MNPLLEEWKEKTKRSYESITGEENAETKEIFASKVTEELGGIITKAYREAVPHKLVWVGAGRDGKKWGTRGVDKEVVEAVQERAAKRQIYEQECGRGRDSEVLKKNWKEAERTVEGILRKRDKEKVERSVSKMEAGFKGDKMEMYEEYRYRMRESRERLPQSLRNSRGEIRSEKMILQEWKARFDLKSEEMGGEEDKDHRKKVEAMVEGYWKEKRADETERKVKWFRDKDVKEVKAKMKMKGAGGEDGVLNSMIKRGSKELNKALRLMANILATLEVIPDKWKLIIMVPAYKKGDRTATSNYRPIGLTSVLYKVYERLLARRMRGVAKIPVEQCGFRKGFGTHTVLKRLQILRAQARYEGKGVYLACIDMQEAFERAWRPGILFRAWEAGVKGKLWRIVANTLQNTFALVRTNFGDTSTFRVTQGVVTGAVLSPLLYSLFFSPMVRVVKGIAVKVQGTEILPQLFADDGTILAHTREQREQMVGTVLRWMRRWNVKVKNEKSAYFSEKGMDERERSESMDQLLKEVEKVTVLGISIMKEGIEPMVYVKELLRRVGKRTKVALEGGLENSLSFGVVNFLYKTYAESILTHSLPFMEHEGYAQKKLQSAQDEFVESVMRSKGKYPVWQAAAEMGVLDMDLQADKARILMHHRIMNNGEDDLTRKMMDWELGEGGKTEKTKIGEALKRVGSGYTVEGIVRLNYWALKHDIKRVVQQEQEKRWKRESARSKAEHKRGAERKGHWGMERFLAKCPAEMARRFVNVRMGAEKGTAVSEGNGRCAKCMAQEASVEHTMWECPSTSEKRNLLYNQVEESWPEVAGRMRRMNPETATDFVTGKGAKQYGPAVWEGIQRQVVRFIWEATGGPRRVRDK